MDAATLGLHKRFPFAQKLSSYFYSSYSDCLYSPCTAVDLSSFYQPCSEWRCFYSLCTDCRSFYPLSTDCKHFHSLCTDCRYIFLTTLNEDVSNHPALTVNISTHSACSECSHSAAASERRCFYSLCTGCWFFYPLCTEWRFFYSLCTDCRAPCVYLDQCWARRPRWSPAAALGRAGCWAL